MFSYACDEHAERCALLNKLHADMQMLAEHVANEIERHRMYAGMFDDALDDGAP